VINSRSANTEPPQPGRTEHRKTIAARCTPHLTLPPFLIQSGLGSDGFVELLPILGPPCWPFSRILRSGRAAGSPVCQRKGLFLPSFCRSPCAALGSGNSSNSGDETMHQFCVGEVVTCISVRYAAPGEYRIIARMPDRDGDHMYKIKSPLEKHERAVNERLLVKSDRCLTEEEGFEQRPPRRSITFPVFSGRLVVTDLF